MSPVDVFGAYIHVPGEGDAPRPRLGHVQRVPVVSDDLVLPAGVATAARTPARGKIGCVIPRQKSSQRQATKF